MPILELEESNYAGLIPEDTILPARVVSVQQQKKPFTDSDGNDIWKMNFAFVVEDPNSPHDATRLWGETSMTFSNNPNCRLFAWAQEILGAELTPPLQLDTDDLAGNACRVVVRVKKYTKDGMEKERNYVGDVMRARASMAFNASSIDTTGEMPF